MNTNAKNNNYHKLITYHAIGDSLLLPYEFLNKKLIDGRFSKYGLKQSLIFNYGLTSDDSDHLLMTTQALLDCENVIDFKNKLARKLKFWLLCLPIGIGATTLKSILKLWMGFSPDNSGINSTGNGPLMRIPIVAFHFAEDSIKRWEYIKACTFITHKNEEVLACCESLGNFISYLTLNKKIPPLADLLSILKLSHTCTWNIYVDLVYKNIHLNKNHFLEKINCRNGVNGYIMNSAIFSIYVLYQKEHPLKQVLLAGGDTDTIGALVASYLSLIDNNELFLDELNFFPKIIINNDIKKMVNKKFWLFLILKNILLIPTVLIHVIIRIFHQIKTFLTR